MKLIAPAALVALASAQALASNLIRNGGFEQIGAAPDTYGPDFETPVEFRTDYYLDSRTNSGAEGSYTPAVLGYRYAGIVEQANDWHPLFDCFGPHEGSHFLIVNGAGPNLTVWEQDVVGASGGSFEFSFWARNAYPDSPALLDFTAYDDTIPLAHFVADLSQTNPSPTGEWVRFSAVFDNLQQYTRLRLVDTNATFSGNDFAIDDIGLNPVTLAVVPLPSQLAAIGVGAVLLARRRRPLRI